MIRVELLKLFRRPRTWMTIGLLDALPTIVAILLAITGVGPRPGQGPAFLSAVLANGSLFAVAALAIVLPLFLPVAVAVVAGDTIAGEAQAGTLRYLLIRPVGRTRLLVAKLVSVFAFVLVSVVLVAGTGFFVGRALLGNQSLSEAVTSVSGSTLTPGQIAARTVLAIGYVAFSMLGVAAVALFLSTVTDSALSASMGALAILIGSSLLLTIDASQALQPYLPTRYWLSFIDLFRDPIL
ncbi:MAG: type transport system permease protein, partial [Pseudonocardiales bacterium]|nr:type transport system permease protein [Pseudonocardiales bacterium]